MSKYKLFYRFMNDNFNIIKKTKLSRIHYSEILYDINKNRYK